MKPQTKLLIERNISCIEQNDFEQLYTIVNKEIYDMKNITDLTETLYKAGIDPLVHMSHVPDYFLYHSDIDIDHIKLPTNISKIGEFSFCGMFNLHSADFSSCISVKRLEDCTFTTCLELKDVKLPPKLEEIYDRVFSDCRQLTNIDLPKTLTYIGANAFERCTSLTSINIPASIVSIGYAPFRSCTNLLNVNFESTISTDTIAAYMFNECTSLSEVVIPEGIEIIRRGAFADCANLKRITLPSTVRVLEPNVFNNCNALTTIVFNGPSKNLPKIPINNSKNIMVVCTNLTLRLDQLYNI